MTDFVRYRHYLYSKVDILQKVSFCKYFRISTGLFFTCRRKKIVIAVASKVIFFLLGGKRIVFAGLSVRIGSDYGSGW